MLRETGRVVAIADDAVWVETVRSSACGRCAARAGCGHGAVASSGSSTGLIRALESSDVAARDCAVGDEVAIELPEEAVLQGSLLVYGLPLISGITLALLAQTHSEPLAILGFVFGLSAGFAVIRWLPALQHRQEQFEPRLADVRKPTQSVIARA